VDRLTQHLLLVLLGAITLVVAVTDAHLAYVKAGFQPFLLFAAAVLLALGSGGVVRAVRTAVARHRAPAGGDEAGSAGGDESGHDHPGPQVAWLLLLPFAVLLLVAPPALGSYTAARQAQPVVVPASQPPPTGGLGEDDPGEDHRSMSLLAYSLRALSDPAAFEGRLVRLVGFVTPREGGGWYVSRIAINCCAADAVSYTVVVDGERGSLAADQWVEVVGRHAPAQDHPAAGYPEAVIEPVSVTPIEPPVDPYGG
jgi:uncharacterized repeat protein (TIGR03943 family)